MPNFKVTLYIRIATTGGKRKMCKPVYASRGRLKPLYAADTEGNSLGHHPEGEYYLRYAGRTEAVGNDPYVALDRLEQRKAELWQSAHAPSAGSLEQPSQPARTQPARAATLDEAITEYLTTGKAAEKNWRKHTRQAYTLGLGLFRESCGKTYLNDVDGDNLRRLKVFLRKRQTQTKTFKKKLDDRTVWNHFNNVVSFLNSYGLRNLIPQSEWPTYEEKPPEALCTHICKEHGSKLQPFHAMNSADVDSVWLDHQRLSFRPALLRPVLAQADDLPRVAFHTCPARCLKPGN